MAIAGSSTYPGLYVAGISSPYERISVAKLVNEVFTGDTILAGSVNAIKPPDNHHEAVVCAAFAFACSAGPLGGYRLEDLVTRYVPELISCVSEGYLVLGTVDNI